MWTTYHPCCMIYVPQGSGVLTTSSGNDWRELLLRISSRTSQPQRLLVNWGCPLGMLFGLRQGWISRPVPPQQGALEAKHTASILKGQSEQAMPKDNGELLRWKKKQPTSGPWHGSAAKGTCCQDWQAEFNGCDSQDRRGELTSASYPLTSTAQHEHAHTTSIEHKWIKTSQKIVKGTRKIIATIISIGV